MGGTSAGYLFTHINSSACFPTGWSHAIVIPLYKNKGDELDCANYTPISLLNAISKLYANCFFSKPLHCVNIENILTEEQAVFRGDQSNLDHCLVLRHLAGKSPFCNLVFNSKGEAVGNTKRDSQLMKSCFLPFSLSISTLF